MSVPAIAGGVARGGRAAAAVSILLAAGCAAPASPAPSDGILLDAPTVAMPLQEGPESCWSVEAFLEGEGPFRLLLDTGATVLALDPSVAARFPPSREGVPLRLRGALGGEPVAVPRGALAEIAFRTPGGPGARVRDVSFASVPAPHGFDGVAGLDLFRGCRVVLDFPRGTLEIARHGPPDRGGPSAAALPVVILRVADTPVSAVLDTGFGGVLYLPRRIADDLPWRGPSPGIVLLHDFRDRRAVEERRLCGEVRLGPAGAADPWVLVGEGDALLGAAFLRDWRVSLDGEGRVTGLEGPGTR